MKYLFHTLDRFRVNNVLMVMRVKTDGETLFVTLRMPNDEVLPQLSISLGYDGVTKPMTKTNAYEMSVTFAYKDSVKTISFSGVTVYYLEVPVTSVTWRGGVDDPDPELVVANDGAHLNASNWVRVISEWTPPGTVLRMLEVRTHDIDPGETEWTHRLYSYNNSFMPHPYNFYVGADMDEGSEFWFRFLYAAFREGDEDDHDGYYGLIEIDSEHGFVSGTNKPLCPRDVTVAAVSSGKKAQLNWAFPPDTKVTTTAAELQRSVNGGEYQAVTSGNVTSYVDTLPAGATLDNMDYRVRAVNSNGSSPWVPAIITVAVPGVPASISIPATINGGTSITVSWTAPTVNPDAVEGYKVERSTDGGSTWSAIYQGAATSTKNTVAFGTDTVMYRVKAYNSEGTESGYKTSSQVNVVNNNPPTKPSSITVPASLLTGVAAVISWGTSSDPDGDSVVYSLERSANNKTDYAEIYRGTDLRYTDTVGSWTEVTYRVRAIDPKGAASDYQTGPTRSVSSNAAPTITCAYEDGTDLGVKSEVFSIGYSVNDTNAGDTLTVKEYVDGVQKKSFTATRGTNYTFNFRSGSAASTDYWKTILNGSHTVTIEVSDGKAKTTRSVKFLKSVSGAYITLNDPVVTTKNIAKVGLSICGSIPAGGITVEVTANADTESPTWEACVVKSTDSGYTVEGRRKSAGANVNLELDGGNYLFLHTVSATGKAFNYRIQADAVDGVGGYISSVQTLIAVSDDGSK